MAFALKKSNFIILVEIFHNFNCNFIPHWKGFLYEYTILYIHNFLTLISRLRHNLYRNVCRMVEAITTTTTTTTI